MAYCCRAFPPLLRLLSGSSSYLVGLVGRLTLEETLCVATNPQQQHSHMSWGRAIGKFFYEGGGEGGGHH